MYQGAYVKIDNFKGGYCGNLSPASLQLNQALDLDNIVIGPNGNYIRTRLGNAKLNTSVFNSGNQWNGLGYFKTAAGTEYIVGVNGTKFATNSGFGTSFTDSTGAISLTSGATNLWDFLTFNDVLIGFGGNGSTPNAPFKWTGSGNAAALGGSPPSAYGAFTVNNRVFAYKTSSNPSTIYWSILGNAEDWTGTGSGSATVGSLSDNQVITGAQVLSTNKVLLFKETSTYQMVITTAPFPIYTLFDQIGCCGKRASVNIEGRVYWINQYMRMVSTDGNDFQTYPSTADDLWNSVSKGVATQIVGFRHRGSDFDWLVWIVDTSAVLTTNTTAIIWDLTNQCWLQATTGFKMVDAVERNTGVVYLAGYDGFVYVPNTSATYADASESPTTITGYWRSGWLNFGDMEKVIQPNELGVLYKTKASGSISLSYGFNFIADSASTTLAQTATSTETRAFKYARLTGRGNFFNFKVSQSSSTIDTFIDQIYIRGKQYGQKVFTNP